MFKFFLITYPENISPSKMSLPLESGSNFDLSREINLFGIRTALKLEFVKDIIDTHDITKIKTTIIALIVLFNLNDFESYLVMFPGVP